MADNDKSVAAPPRQPSAKTTRPYIVLRKSADDTYSVVGRDIEAANDKAAIAFVIPESAEGTFVAVSRFVEHTTRPKQITKREWA